MIINAELCRSTVDSAFGVWRANASEGSCRCCTALVKIGSHAPALDRHSSSAHPSSVARRPFFHDSRRCGDGAIVNSHNMAGRTLYTRRLLHTAASAISCFRFFDWIVSTLRSTSLDQGMTYQPSDFHKMLVESTPTKIPRPENMRRSRGCTR